MLEIWNKETPVTVANGTVYSTLKSFGAAHPEANARVTLIEKTPDGRIVAIQDLDILKLYHPDTANMPDEEAVRYINEEMAKPPAPPAPEQVPATKAEVLALGQQMTDLELMILEGGGTNV